MSKLMVLGLAFALLLGAFPLISVGTAGGNATLWRIGLAMLAIGALVPPLTRFIMSDDEDAASDGAEHDGEER